MDWLAGTDTWQRLMDFTGDDWHNLVSIEIWAITFTVIFLVPLKRTREWTPLAVGLTAISAILAMLLHTAALNMIWPAFQLGVVRPLFRDFGSVVNIIIIIKVIFPGDTNDDDDNPPGGPRNLSSQNRQA